MAAGHGEDDGITYAANPSASDDGGIRVDYAFVDQSMLKRVHGAWTDKAAQGSDHQPLWLDLDYAPYD